MKWLEGSSVVIIDENLKRVDGLQTTLNIKVRTTPLGPMETDQLSGGADSSSRRLLALTSTAVGE